MQYFIFVFIVSVELLSLWVTSKASSVSVINTEMKLEPRVFTCTQCEAAAVLKDTFKPLRPLQL